MLTKNLYSLDEVQACLLHRHCESAFWCNELIVSGYIGEVISTLFQSWLWNDLSSQWLLYAWQHLAICESEKDILIANKLLKCKGDNSLWHILVLTIQDPNTMPDTVTRKTPKFNCELDDKEMYLARAIYQGKARSAFWISQYMGERFWFVLDLFNENKICLQALLHYEELLGYKSDEYDMIVKCAAILIMVSKDKVKVNNKVNNKVEVEVKDSRKHSIPHHLLYGITERGRKKWSQNNFDQLNIENLKGCPYWEEAALEAPQMYEDDFYYKYFPDGFPETIEEKEKSHGCGVLGPNEKVSLRKYSRNFMSGIPKFALITLKNLDVDSIESLFKLYVKPDNLHVSLRPVQKKLFSASSFSASS